MDLKDILPEFQKFLRERKIAHENSIPYYAVWVSKFLAFVNRDARGDIDAQVIAFIEQLQSDPRVKDWQVRNAHRALNLYLDHYGGRSTLRSRLNQERPDSALRDVTSVLNEMRRLIRLKHYAYSTERTYLDWAKRFFAYLAETKRAAPDKAAQVDVKNFLSHLAIAQRISASSQNQAFNSMPFSSCFGMYCTKIWAT